MTRTVVWCGVETGDRKKGLREKLWFRRDRLEVPGAE